ncbi:DUF3145 family protein [Nocardiopsis sp. CC223A]
MAPCRRLAGFSLVGPNRLTGRAWGGELEPFRYAGDGAPVRWLHAVG